MAKLYRSRSGQLITPQLIREEAFRVLKAQKEAKLEERQRELMMCNAEFIEHLRELKLRRLERKYEMKKRESDKRLAEHVYQTGKLFERIGDRSTNAYGTTRYTL